MGGAWGGRVTFTTFSSETDPKINSRQDENIDLLLQEDFPGMRANGQWTEQKVAAASPAPPPSPH